MASGSPTRLESPPGDDHREETIRQLLVHVEYVVAMEQALSDLASKREAEVKARIRAGNVDYHDDGMSVEEARHIYHFDFAFTDRLRYSAISLLYSTWEIRTKAPCDEVSNRFDLPWKLRDLKGSTFDCCKVYFTKACPVDIVQWPILEALQKIRDCIVHTGGVVGKSRDKEFLNQLPRRFKDIDIIGDALHLEPGVHKIFFQAARDFFETVFRSKNFGPCYAPFPRWSDELGDVGK
jgi:hypothetical protein